MKQLFGTLAGLLTFALFLPYIRSIRRGKIKPHVFSWIVWGAGTLIVSLAQLAGGGGSGAWVICVSGLISCYIALLSYLKRGDIRATATDWAFLVVALSALPFWFLTSNPLWAVVILTLVDLLGFAPTIRKAYARPHQESVAFFAFSFVRNMLVLVALEEYSTTTILFPATVGVACLLLALLLVYRKRIVARNQ